VHLYGLGRAEAPVRAYIRFNGPREIAGLSVNRMHRGTGFER
jgi:hypothetical protein